MSRIKILLISIDNLILRIYRKYIYIFWYKISIILKLIKTYENIKQNSYKWNYKFVWCIASNKGQTCHNSWWMLALTFLNRNNPFLSYFDLVNMYDILNWNKSFLSCFDLVNVLHWPTIFRLKILYPYVPIHRYFAEISRYFNQWSVLARFLNYQFQGLLHSPIGASQ